MKREFIEHLLSLKGEKVAVATIVKTIGSTPRKAGTTMIVRTDGSIVGTIGGGRAENEIRLAAIEVLKAGKSHGRLLVTLNDEVAVKEGMVCGGTLDVWIEVV